MRPSDLQIRYQFNMAAGNIVAIVVATAIAVVIWPTSPNTGHGGGRFVPPAVETLREHLDRVVTFESFGFQGGWIDRSRLTVVREEADILSRLSAPLDNSPPKAPTPAIEALLPISPRYTQADLVVGSGYGPGDGPRQTLVPKEPLRLDHGLIISHFEPPGQTYHARRYGLYGGIATVRLSLDSTGKILSLETVAEKPPGYDLGAALTERLLACRFTPPVIDGRRVSMTVRITYDWSRPGPLEVWVSSDIGIILR